MLPLLDVPITHTPPFSSEPSSTRDPDGRWHRSPKPRQHQAKASLRLYPPVPLNNRTAIRTTILPTGGGPDGYSPILVRKGEVVVFSQYVNSRRKNIYGQDAAEFRPERWETGELTGIGYAYFPFHGGPRQCLGEDFAITEISYTIVRLLQAYPSVTLCDEEPVEPVGSERQLLTLVLSSADGCRVRLKDSGYTQ